MVDADFNVLVALFIWLVGGAELTFTGRYVFLIALQPVYPLALLDTHCYCSFIPLYFKKDGFNFIHQERMKQDRRIIEILPGLAV